MKSNELTASKPVAVWNKSISLEPKKLLFGIGKTVIKGVLGDLSGVSDAILDTVDAAGLREKPEELAWLLISRALTAAFFELVKEHRDLFRNRPDEEQLRVLSSQFEEQMGKEEVRINAAFFNQPEALPLLKNLQGPLAAWLRGLGAQPADAEQIACRLPKCFVFALDEIWHKDSQSYAELINYFDSPFFKATEEVRSWQLYAQWLQRQASDRMFAEAFGVDKVYVPLRAYYEEKAAKDSGRQADLHEDERSKRIVVDLERDVRDWLKANAEPAVRFISGGPGSGKSTFAKHFAAKIAKETDIPCLYIPLHRFKATDDLIAAMESHIRHNPFLIGNPLDAKTGKDRLLIIFDGLDELAMQGKAASETANNFVDEVLRCIHEGNGYGKQQRQVIITGRTIAVQAVMSKLRKPKQITHVLPYFVAKEERKQYHDPAKLLQIDQRQQWWRQYGAAAGKDYVGLPADLARRHLLEITAQPLLNYLLALSYDRQTITFTDETTLNQIYADLIKAVYHRQYADCGQGTACVSELDEEQFVRVLEEIALAVWHGDGRTATIAGIRKRFKAGQAEQYLERFQEGAKAGVTRLLTAFYFRQSDSRQNGEPTFEFTHKSFGEYLTALRIVRVLRQMQKQRRRKKEDPDDGWSEKEALQHWTSFCAVTWMDDDLLRFISNEFRAMTQAELLALQEMVRELLSYTINQGLPFPDEFLGKGFKEHLRLAGNAEGTLLAVHFYIAELTKKVSRLELENNGAFGEWFRRVNGPGGCTGLLGYLDLSCYDLAEQMFGGANFTMSILKGAQLYSSILADANLQGVQLENASLWQSNLQDANLAGANLKGANLLSADLRDADLEGANVEGAKLDGAVLTGTILEKKEA